MLQGCFGESGMYTILCEYTHVVTAWMSTRGWWIKYKNLEWRPLWKDWYIYIYMIMYATFIGLTITVLVSVKVLYDLLDTFPRTDHNANVETCQKSVLTPSGSTNKLQCIVNTKSMRAAGHVLIHIVCAALAWHDECKVRRGQRDKDQKRSRKFEQLII